MMKEVGDVSILFIGSALVVCIGLLSGMVVFWRVPSLRTTQPPTFQLTSTVTIIIPARNEAQRIQLLLQSIVCQEGVQVKTIVVDDHSTDATRQVAESFGVRVLENETLEEGWTGKSAACWTGANAADSDLLLFIDADTVFSSPTSLLAYLSDYEEMGGTGILSLQPDHKAERWYEQLASIFPVVVMMGMNVFTVVGDAVKSAGSFGPCVLCRKDEYGAVGGHASVRGAVMDDLALGKKFQEKQLPVRCYSGRGIAWLRMYPGGFRQLIQGYSKSMASGSVATHPLVMLLINAWIVGGVLSPLLLLFAAFSGKVGFLLVAGTLVICYMASVARAIRKAGNFSFWTVPLYPVLFLFFIGVFMYSLYLAKWRKRVRWSGRDIQV